MTRLLIAYIISLGKHSEKSRAAVVAEISAISLALSIMTVGQAYAYPGFLTQFNTQYPASSTGEGAGCAVCHSDGSGGEPWNAFGRDLLANGASGLGAAGNIQSTLVAIELLNSDAVAGDNLTEITAHAQPGWCDTILPGCTNTLYLANGSESGTGSPPIVLLDDESTTPQEPNIQLTQTIVEFGETLISASTTASVNIANAGQLDLTLLAEVGGAEFAIETQPDTSVSPGSSTSVTVSYNPVDAGADVGTLTITSNDPDSPIVVLDLTGTGTTEPPSTTAECPAGIELSNPIPATIASGMEVDLITVADGFVNPVLGVAPLGDKRRLFVVDQPGQMWAVSLDTGEKNVFLDLSEQLVTLDPFGIGYDERGFLGAAFSPTYFRDGLVYTHSSGPADQQPADFSTMPAGVMPDHRSVVTEWRVPNPRNASSVVDPSSARVLLRVDQPQFNHNGGSVVFGMDNMLYITLGDGGGADDQGNSGDDVGHSTKGNGQDTSNVLGSVLRIDPRGNNSSKGQYGIPVDNPFVTTEDLAAGSIGGEPGCGDGKCDEIYAYGFRNGWRASFDTGRNGTFMISDVGQNDIEEIDIVRPGGNYGWRIKDGSFCFDNNGSAAGFVTDAVFVGPPDIIDPIAQYDHDEGLSITGGFVYRGNAIRALKGHYVFGDWSKAFLDPVPGRLFYLADGDLKSSDSNMGTILEFRLPNRVESGVNSKINGFGQDGMGEIYVIGSERGLLVGVTGKVQKIVPVRAR